MLQWAWWMAGLVVILASAALFHTVVYRRLGALEAAVMTLVRRKTPAVGAAVGAG